MYRVFRSGNYEKRLDKLDGADQKRVMDFEQSLKMEQTRKELWTLNNH